MDPISFIAPMQPSSNDDVLEYKLQLIGSLTLHAFTTMPMLPWVVAEIKRKSLSRSKEPQSVRPVRLYVSALCICCEPDPGESHQWDPLICSSIFEYKPQSLQKLIHNSQDPSYFACLLKEEDKTPQRSTCYVFRSAAQSKVPEIIGSIRQAGKLARQEEVHSHLCDGDDAFSKKFEVLFCGRVIVAHKKAPPALIDECIDKFNHVSCTKKKETDCTSPVTPVTLLADVGTGISFGDKLRSVFQSTFNDEEKQKPIRKSYSQPGLRTNHSFQRDWKDGPCSLPGSFEDGDSALDLQYLSEEYNCVQPTDMEENQTMLFTIGQSEVYLISPDTKRIVFEKSFKEISFCSQGIQHVDHFGFICREPIKNGGCHFVCYVFQCTNEALVDEIMLTLKQAFSVAAVHQTSKMPTLLCDGCPMQCMHKLCEKIEGLPPSKTKLELQKHITTLNNQEQASVFEEIQKIRPRSEQKENELIISRLRCLYEEKQRDHVHIVESKQNSQNAANPLSELQSSASRFKLELLKSKAKRSLTESLDSILSMGNKSRCQQDSSRSMDYESALCTPLEYSSKESSVCEMEAALSPEMPLKAHGSLGDLPKAAESFPSDHPGELCHQGFRRRANTLSHFPVTAQDFPEPVQKTPSVPQRKLMRHHSVSTETPHKRNSSTDPGVPESSTAPCEQAAVPSPPTTATSSPLILRKLRHSSGGEPLAAGTQKSDFDCTSINSDVEARSPVRTRRHSWRQQIFLRVATPQKGCDSPNRFDERSEWGDIPPRSPLQPVRENYPFVPVETARHRSPADLRELWKKAILQQILLLRMEKENQKLLASENDLQNKRLKLDYEEITPCLKDVTVVWEKMLGTPGRAKIKTDMEKIHGAVGQGVPRPHRGEIWMFLTEQHQLRHQVPNKSHLKDIPYKELLKQLTTQQHAILIDLGRTFPTHPYFSAQLGAGQLSLYNILKAYSLLDPEVGYCQGLSFVAGVVLLHMSEEDAFKLLKFLMYDVGLRKQYRPDMVTLQIQMYQLSRLLHDYHRDLYNHLEEFEIGPSLYAAPWFLTMFASQFPLGFVARVFDLIFLQGSEVIFKVALSLLGSHKPLILQQENLESIVEFIKNTLPNLGLVQMEKTINQVFEMNISKQLQDYEVEYHVLQDELIDSSPLSDNQRINKLEKANNGLRKQNFDLLEELQVSKGRIQSLESTVDNLQSNEAKLKQALYTLELERSAMLTTIEELKKQIMVYQENGVQFEQKA
ncbi:TBC1 domain family member 1 isoform X2 [Rana temporaria]|uniref:TBC1 domain family member 1 isoform X2 n=1 Tax=Rana temporaria TaxID=8407 RepID=UPI001AACF88E|nr:TBC1 domain family member 1 isoform X2 [Rana temporaria]